MKTVERYCKRCQGRTLHDYWKKEEGAARVFFAVFTLGVSEGMKTHCYECQRCGRFHTIQQ